MAPPHGASAESRDVFSLYLFLGTVQVRNAEHDNRVNKKVKCNKEKKMLENLELDKGEQNEVQCN